jgi:hypothetical protein
MGGELQPNICEAIGNFGCKNKPIHNPCLGIFHHKVILVVRYVHLYYLGGISWKNWSLKLLLELGEVT